DRRLDYRVRDPELYERLEVGGHGAREPPDLGGQLRLGDQLDRLPVVVGDAREPGLDAADAELVEQTRDLELLLRVEHDPDRLLAVAQRRVVEPDVPADRIRVVQGPGPDQVLSAHAAATTPSGNEESFSAPPAVTTKLSSTRRPPPPSR